MKISVDELDLENQVAQTWQRVKKKPKKNKVKTLKYSAICSVLKTNYHIPSKSMSVGGEKINDPLRFVATYLKKDVKVESRREILSAYPAEIAVPVLDSENYAHFYRRK